MDVVGSHPSFLPHLQHSYTGREDRTKVRRCQQQWCSQSIIQYKNTWKCILPQQRQRSALHLLEAAAAPWMAAIAPQPALGHTQPLGMVFTFRGSKSIRPRFLSKHAGVIFKLLQSFPRLRGAFKGRLWTCTRGRRWTKAGVTLL